jgi:AcrR family transcriptional regulator
VTHQAPYRHFADKTALIAAVADVGFRALEAEIREALARHEGSATERLETLGVAYVRFACAHPAQFRLMFGPEIEDRAPFPELRAAADGLMATLTQTIVEAQREKGVAPGDPLDMALAGWAIVHGLSSLVVDGRLRRYPYGKQTPDDVARLVLRVLVEGMRPRTRSSSK